MLEEVRRLKRENKEGMEKQEDLMSSAKVLQRRITRQSKVINCDFICFPNISASRRESKADQEFKKCLHFQNKK